MCKWFEEGLNEDIKLLVGILELKEFVVLVDRAHKVEELSKEKRQVEMEVRTLRYSGRDRSIQSSSPTSQAIFVASADGLSNVISAMLAQKYVRKGYDAYLAYVLDIKVSESKIKLVPVVCEYPYVFAEELLGLPLVREVKFSINLVPGTTPISIAPYRMAPTELKELKAQLKELTDRGFARPSFSLLCALVLFVKKKDGSLRLCIDCR
ncbi:uncharacterized protein LOC105775507 [Gossypium raimondii]|uniref:uncharacterized protein LOC105775507 n=1 Tax=Gossypium raimondii TaxID=29730 RepID=UPI00063AE4FC|nr:uncharacterized protein LOC105775507 [Gossypium raimondii]